MQLQYCVKEMDKKFGAEALNLQVGSRVIIGATVKIRGRLGRPLHAHYRHHHHHTHYPKHNTGTYTHEHIHTRTHTRRRNGVLLVWRVTTLSDN